MQKIGSMILGAVIAVFAHCAAIAQNQGDVRFTLATGAGHRDCDNLLTRVNETIGRHRLVPPIGKRFEHGISWRELQHVAGVQDVPWKMVEPQYIEALTLGAVQFDTPRVVSYIHFLDSESPWLKGKNPSSGWVPPHGWSSTSDSQKAEIVTAVRNAMQKFLDRGGLVKYVAYADVNPSAPANLGFAQYEHRAGMDPVPSVFSPGDVLQLDRTMLMGIEMATFEFSRQMGGGDIGVDSRLILFDQQPFTMTHSSFGGTRLISAGRAPIRNCFLEPNK